MYLTYAEKRNPNEVCGKDAKERARPKLKDIARGRALDDRVSSNNPTPSCSVIGASEELDPNHIMDHMRVMCPSYIPLVG